MLEPQEEKAGPRQLPITSNQATAQTPPKLLVSNAKVMMASVSGNSTVILTTVEYRSLP